MEQNIHILVVDDEPDIRTILHILLENKGYHVEEAANGQFAVDAVRANPQLDLVILDIMMPEMGGIEAAKQIRALSPAPILFLTARTQEQDKVEAYGAGGDDFLAKPFSHTELQMKVESLLRRYRVYKGKLSGTVLRQNIVLDEETRGVRKNGEAVELTEKEFAILQYLAERRGSVVSVEDIFEGVWHERYMPASSNTVMVHIVNLRKKLEDDPQSPRLIRTVWGKGYQVD